MTVCVADLTVCGPGPQDTHKPFLHLSNLEKGVYEFMLKVTDSAEHTSTDSVLVVVKSQPNTPPTGTSFERQTRVLAAAHRAARGARRREGPLVRSTARFSSAVDQIRKQKHLEN